MKLITTMLILLLGNILIFNFPSTISVAPMTIIGGVSLAGRTIVELSNASPRNSEAIQISNFLEVSLTDVQYFVDWGSTINPPTNFIQSGYREATVFGSSWYTMSGTSGLLSYSFTPPGKSIIRFVIIFSVPFDRRARRNWFGLKFVPTNTVINKQLFDQMEYQFDYGKPWGSSANYEYAENNRAILIQKDGFKVAATMGNGGRSIILANVYK